MAVDDGRELMPRARAAAPDADLPTSRLRTRATPPEACPLSVGRFVWSLAGVGRAGEGRLGPVLTSSSAGASKRGEGNLAPRARGPLRRWASQGSGGS